MVEVFEGGMIVSLHVDTVLLSQIVLSELRIRKI